jgi:hypothetical protein
VGNSSHSAYEPSAKLEHLSAELAVLFVGGIPAGILCLLGRLVKPPEHPVTIKFMGFTI